MGKTMQYFLGWLNNTVIYEKFLIRDGAGEETYEASSNLSCYLEGRTTLVIGPSGEEVISTEKIYIDGADTKASGITEDDRFTVRSKVRPVQSIARYYDETGTLDYLVVYL